MEDIGIPEKPHETDELPEIVTIEWICSYLKIHRSSFYRNIYKKLLFPAKKIGRISYYLLRDVKMLFALHEKGAHTYSKMRKAKEKQQVN